MERGAWFGSFGGRRGPNKGFCYAKTPKRGSKWSVCLSDTHLPPPPATPKSKIQSKQSKVLTIRNATMSDDQETKPTEETTPKVEEEPKKEEDDKVKEEESTATFEPVVSKFLLWARKKMKFVKKCA